MERAGRSLAKLKLSGKISGEDLACAAWSVAVGKVVAAHSHAACLVRERLVVEVEDAVWQKQLFHLRRQIIQRLRELIGEALVTDIEFRIETKRRPPQVATVAGNDVTDDADTIHDPALRLIYKQSRRKASA